MSTPTSDKLKSSDLSIVASPTSNPINTEITTNNNPMSPISNMSSEEQQQDAPKELSAPITEVAELTASTTTGTPPKIDVGILTPKLCGVCNKNVHKYKCVRCYLP
jgi:hypothetical protein